MSHYIRKRINMLEKASTKTSESDKSALENSKELEDDPNFSAR